MRDCTPTKRLKGKTSRRVPYTNLEVICEMPERVLTQRVMNASSSASNV